MTCLSQHKDGADILVNYFERKLDPARTAALKAHVAECTECRQLVGVWDTLEDWSPTPQISANFDAKLYARIAAEPVSWWQRMLDVLRPAVPLVAGTAALAVVLMQSPAPEPQTKAKVEPVNIEQVEQNLEDLELLAPLGPAAEM